MKKKISNIFDDFIIAARVMPAVTIVIPFLILALDRGLIANNLGEATVEFVIAATLAMCGGNIAREKGKDFEKKMYADLGAVPTTIVMRFSDDRIDEISKKRYHEWLNQNGYGMQLPLSLEEERRDSQSDKKYINAMANLRKYANDHREEIPRVYQELKKYNYWRNLYGCKKLAVVVYICTIILEILQLFLSFYFDWFMQSISYFVGIIGMMAWTITFCFVVTKNTVKRNAFDYAITLMETSCSVE